VLWSLWKKILEGIELLIEFIEFLFEWKDIQATHKSLTHVMNNGLNLAIKSVSKIQRKALFDDLENEIRDLKPVKDSTPLIKSRARRVTRVRICARAHLSTIYSTR
jgi:hypothetical protein